MTRRYLVSGYVQGVGFRWFVRRVAQEQGLTGWVRNLRDGRVEAEADGTPEALAQFERRLREGPAGAAVRSVEVEERSEAAPRDGFQIVH
ncbi:MAG: acylphosphatase [Thermoanaerobaculia bacterium]